MIKFLLDALNNCDSKKAKYIKIFYYKYCKLLYNDIDDNIYSNEDLFEMFLEEFIEVKSYYTQKDLSGNISYYVLKPSGLRFNLSRSNEHTVAHLRAIISYKNKWDGIHKLINNA